MNNRGVSRLVVVFLIILIFVLLLSIGILIKKNLHTSLKETENLIDKQQTVPYVFSPNSYDEWSDCLNSTQTKTITQNNQTSLETRECKAYFIDPVLGNDASAGTIDDPWKTLDRPFGKFELKGGEYLYLRGGIHRFNEKYMDGHGNQFDENQISGTPDKKTVISGYPGEKAAIYFSVNASSLKWLPYITRPGTHIWYIDWKDFIKNNYPQMYIENGKYENYFIPRLIVLNKDPSNPKFLQEVNSFNHSLIALEKTYMDSVRNSQLDMISGDFYYEKDNQSSSHGDLFIWLPDGSNPNGKEIEIGLMSRMSFASQHDIIIKNISFRYANENYGSTIWLWGHDNLLENLDVSYNAFAAVVGNCINCTLRNSILSFNGNGGSVFIGDNTTIENNLIEGNNWRNFSKDWHCGMKIISTSEKNMIFRNNRFVNNNCQDIWFDYENSGGGNIIENNIFTNTLGYEKNFRAIEFEVSSGTLNNPNIVRNNIFYNHSINSEVGGGVDIASSSHILVYNNLFYNTASGALIDIDPNSINAERRAAVGNKIFNNIFYNVKFPIGIVQLNSDFIKPELKPKVTIDNNTANNNIYYNNNTQFCYAYCSGGATINYSVWKNKYGLDKDSIFADPKINFSNGKFSLSIDSPAIESGANVSEVQYDFYGNERTKGKKFNIGPFQK